jgi:hypothetical protein
MSTERERTRTTTGEMPGQRALLRPGGGGGGPGRWGLVLGVFLAVLLGTFAAPLVYPLRLFTVLLHEGSHALVALLTGGSVVEIAVRAEESGHTLTQGGFPFFVLQAGYLGSLLFGLLLAWVPPAARGPTVLLGALALFALGWIPVISFGFFYTLLVGLGLVALGLKTSHTTCRLVLRGLGLFVVADAVRDILSDFGRGDAALLMGATGVPSPVWSILWLGAAIAVLVAVVRRAR